jgi:hypothetical protein
MEADDFSNRKPPKEVFGRVLDEFFIFEPEEQLSLLASFEPALDSSKKLIAEALDGLRSVASAASLPYHLESASIQQRHFDRIHTAERIRSLKFEEYGSETLSEKGVDRALKSARKKMREFISTKDGIDYFRNEIVNHMNYLLERDHVKIGLNEIRVQSLISIWSVFENSSRSFIIDVLNNFPSRSIAITQREDLKAYFGKKAVDIDLIEVHGFNLERSMGNILFHERRLDNLSAIRSIFDSLFSDNAVREALGSDMWMLNQRRHLFVHKRGIVDLEYISRTGDMMPIGQRLSLTSEMIEKYITIVEKAVIAIATAADDVLAENG